MRRKVLLVGLALLTVLAFTITGTYAYDPIGIDANAYDLTAIGPSYFEQDATAIYPYFSAQLSIDIDVAFPGHSSITVSHKCDSDVSTDTVCVMCEMQSLYVSSIEQISPEIEISHHDASSVTASHECNPDGYNSCPLCGTLMQYLLYALYPDLQPKEPPDIKMPIIAQEPEYLKIPEAEYPPVEIPDIVFPPIEIPEHGTIIQIPEPEHHPVEIHEPVHPLIEIIGPEHHPIEIPEPEHQLIEITGPEYQPVEIHEPEHQLIEFRG